MATHGLSPRVPAGRKTRVAPSRDPLTPFSPLSNGGDRDQYTVLSCCSLIDKHLRLLCRVMYAAFSTDRNTYHTSAFEGSAYESFLSPFASRLKHALETDLGIKTAGTPHPPDLDSPHAKLMVTEVPSPRPVVNDEEYQRNVKELLQAESMKSLIDNMFSKFVPMVVSAIETYSARMRVQYEDSIKQIIRTKRDVAMLRDETGELPSMFVPDEPPLDESEEGTASRSEFREAVVKLDKENKNLSQRFEAQKQLFDDQRKLLLKDLLLARDLQRGTEAMSNARKIKYKGKVMSIRALCRELETLENKMEEQSQLVSEMSARNVARLEAQQREQEMMKKMEGDYAKLKTELRNSSSRVKQLEKDLEKANDDLKFTRQDVERLKKIELEYDLITGTSNAQEQEEESKESDPNNASGRDLISEIAAAEMAEAAASEEANVQPLLQELSNKVRDLEERNGSLREVVDAKNADIERFRNVIVPGLDTQISEYEAECERLSSYVRLLERKVHSSTDASGDQQQQSHSQRSPSSAAESSPNAASAHSDTGDGGTQHADDGDSSPRRPETRPDSLLSPAHTTPEAPSRPHTSAGPSRDTTVSFAGETPQRPKSMQATTLGELDIRETENGESDGKKQAFVVYDRDNVIVSPRDILKHMKLDSSPREVFNRGTNTDIDAATMNYLLEDRGRGNETQRSLEDLSKRNPNFPFPSPSSTPARGSPVTPASWVGNVQLRGNDSERETEQAASGVQSRVYRYILEYEQIESHVNRLLEGLEEKQALASGQSSPSSKRVLSARLDRSRRVSVGSGSYADIAVCSRLQSRLQSLLDAIVTTKSTLLRPGFDVPTLPKPPVPAQGRSPRKQFISRTTSQDMAMVTPTELLHANELLERSLGEVLEGNVGDGSDAGEVSQPKKPNVNFVTSRRVAEQSPKASPRRRPNPYARPIRDVWPFG